MSQTIDVNGQSINYPETGDTNWGDEATDFAVQTSAALGKLGLASGTTVDIGQTLDVTGNTTLDANLSVGGDASVTGNTTLTGNITVNGNSTLGNGTSDTTAISGILNVDSGVLYVDPVNNRIGINNITPSQALDVTGNAAITGNETVGGTLNVTGATSLSSTLGVTGDVAINTNKFNVTASSGNTTIAGTLGVTGNTTVDGVIYADDSTTANTPVLSFTGDTNTGIGRSGADTLDFITNGNSRFRIESTGQIKAVYESQVGTDYNTQLDNGYLCRAWVNIDGTATQRTGTYTISGTTVTISITSHGLSTGNLAQLDFSSGDGVDGRYSVTVINANSYTITNPVSGSTGGNVTQDSMIRASGNVSSITDNATGDYTVNFTTAMPDINYCAVGTNGFNASGSGTYAGFNRNPSTGGEIAPTTSGIRYQAILNGSVVTQDCKYNYVAIFR
jgi:trimeric autotransporter adhesin